MTRIAVLTLGARRSFIRASSSGVGKRGADDPIVLDGRVDEVLGFRERGVRYVGQGDVNRARCRAEASGHGVGRGHVDQGAREHVLRRVLGHVIAPSREVDRARDGPGEVGRLERRGLAEDVVDLLRVVDLNVQHRELPSADAKRSLIAELTAGLRVKERLIQDERRLVSEAGEARAPGFEGRAEGVLPVQLLRRHPGDDNAKRLACKSP